MRRALLLACLLMPGPQAWAAELDADSAVVAATLYAQGASVERRAGFSAQAGRHSVLIEGMPADYRRESLRIEGRGAFRILSIEERYEAVRALEARRGGGRYAVEREIEALQARRARVAAREGAANRQLAFLDAMTEAQAGASARPGDAALVDAEQWTAMWASVGEGARTALDARLDAREALREIDETLETLRAELNDAGQPRMPGPVLAVEIEAEAAVSGTLTLRYQMNDANWAPVYDARLSLAGEPTVELVRRARVRQGSGEDWAGVALRLSTARPGGRTTVPDPRPLFARIVDPRERAKVAREAMRAPEMAADSYLAPPPPPAPMVAEAAPVRAGQAMAVARFEGETVEYRVPGGVDIDGSGAVKQVLIDAREAPVTLEARATPSLDETAYLYAAFENEGDAPILPGTAALYRDGVFVGTARLDRVAGGDETDLPFGRYDPIQVSHTERERMEGEAGLIRSRQTETRRYIITARNLGTRAMDVMILDSMPYAEDEDVEISLRANPMPTERDVEGRRGALAWRFALGPGDSREIEHGYDVVYPQEVILQLPR